MENIFIENMKSEGLYYQNNLCELFISDDILGVISREMASRYHILPVFREGSDLIVVTDSEQPFKSRKIIEQRIRTKIRLMVTDKDNLKMALLKFYHIENYKQMDASAYATQTEIADSEATPLKMKIEELLQDAAEERASDIHLLPFSGGIYVAFRVNGHMTDYTDRYGFSPDQAPLVANIIKQKDTSGQADMNRNNMPDSGSFNLRHGGTPFFVRLATVPVGNTSGLQKVNLRLLPRDGRRVSLDQIGYPENDLKVIKSTLFKYPTGLFLNSGPTGAGKTTSLYAQMYYCFEVAGEPLNIMTIDNPIEIREEKFTQVQVHRAESDSADLSEKKILKIGLRSDPDMFLYNEIRDKLDAEVALEASTTGHRVFSTVHATNCTKTISRLMDLGVSRLTLLSEMRMIISQRLVGVLCPYCSRPHEISDEELAILTDKEIEKLTSDGVTLRERAPVEERGKCGHCHYGLQGRTAIAEFVVFTNPIRDALINQKGFTDVEQSVGRSVTTS